MNILINILISIIAGLVTGFFVEWLLSKKEKKRLLFIKNEIMNKVLSDTKIYIQFFIDKPINCNKNELIDTLINKLNQILINKQKSSCQRSDIKNLLLQMNEHINIILRNELDFKFHEWLTDKQMVLLNDVYKNINLYLTKNDDSINYCGVTSSLLEFYKNISVSRTNLTSNK